MDEGRLSDALRVPYLTDARFTSIKLSKDGEPEYLEIQTSHLNREFPIKFNDEKRRPKKVTVQQQFIVKVCREHGKVAFEAYPVGPSSVADSTIVYRRYSPNFKWSVAAIKRTDSYFLQVWREGEYWREFEMDQQGDWSTDEFFGWTAWDEGKGWFIYQAEGPEPKPGQQDYKWSPSYGETIPNKKSPTIFILNLEDGQIVAKLPCNEHYTPTQIMYNEKDGNVYFVGYERLPKQFGMAYCINRPTALYCWPYKGHEAVQLTSQHQVEVVYYPVLDSSRDRIIFFGTYMGGSHFHAFSVYEVSLISGRVSKLIKDEQMPQGDVPGLFPILNPHQSLPTSGSLLFSSYCGPEKALLSIDTLNNTCSIVSNPLDDGTRRSWKVHQVSNDLVLASWSTRSCPPCLVLGVTSGHGSIDWFDIDPADEQSGIVQQVYNVDKYIDIILSMPVEKNPMDLPLIVFPHGGPNYSYVAEYSPFCAAAVKYGYAVAASKKILHSRTSYLYSQLYWICGVRTSRHSGS